MIIQVKLQNNTQLSFYPLAVSASVSVFVPLSVFVVFLAVQNSSIGDLVPWSVRLTKLTIRVFTTPQRLVTFETFDQNDEET